MGRHSYLDSLLLTDSGSKTHRMWLGLWRWQIFTTAVLLYIYRHLTSFDIWRHIFSQRQSEMNLLPGWTPFFLQNCFNSLWHRFNKVLETLLRDFGPYWHDSITQLLQICRLHIHDVNLPFHHIPRCSIELRSGDCGGHLSKVNSLSCSRNQSEMIWALWHGVLSFWKYSSEDGYPVVIKRWTWSATILRLAVAFKQCSICT